MSAQQGAVVFPNSSPKRDINLGMTRQAQNEPMGRLTFGLHLFLAGWPPVTQAALAERFRFSVATVRDWEQGRRTPNLAARMLLLLIVRNPVGMEAAIQTVNAARQ